MFSSVSVHGVRREVVCVDVLMKLQQTKQKFAKLFMFFFSGESFILFIFLKNKIDKMKKEKNPNQNKFNENVCDGKIDFV